MAVTSRAEEKDGGLLARFRQNDGGYGTRLVFGGLGAVIIASFVVNAIWGAQMAFPFDVGRQIGGEIDDAIRWVTREGAFILDPIADAVLWFLVKIEEFFLWMPWPVLILAVTAIAYKVADRAVAIFALATLFLMGVVGLWESTMETLALIVLAVILSIVIAVPVGVTAARNDRLDAILRPVLDAMQTMPSFVYLVPAVMLFGIGNVPGIFATIIYAVAPAIRLTNLGIRTVSGDVVEAARSFGTTPRQLLWKVQIPMAVPTIMAGINQTTMMALAMVVIAALVGAGGLGEDVLRALNRFQPGRALLGGAGIVVLAIIIDRITQAAARERQDALMGEHG